MTDYKTAKEEILGTYSSDELKDMVQFGCRVGAASKHNDYSETTKFFDKYEKEITQYLNKTVEGFLEDTLKECDNDLREYKHCVAWTFIEIIADEEVGEEIDYSHEDEDEEEEE